MRTRSGRRQSAAVRVLAVVAIGTALVVVAIDAALVVNIRREAV